MAHKPQEVRPRYHSVNECEIVSGLSRWTWRRWAYSGKVASVKVGPRLLIPAAEIDRVMAEGLRPANANPEVTGASR